VEGRNFLLAVAAAALLLLAVIVWFYPSNEDFRAENPSWNGGSAFTDRFNMRALNGLQGLSAQSQRTVLVVVPYLPFADAELEGLRGYLSRGGTLLLMDDYGHGNEILGYLGLQARFTGESLLDPMLNFKNGQFPRVMDFPSVGTADGVGSIVLNHASSLMNVAEDQVLARSSRFSFLDLDGDSVPGEDEPAGPFPVAASLRFGEGRVLLVTDPSLLINSMEDMADNGGFVRNLLQAWCRDCPVLFDVSHIGQGPLDEARGFLSLGRQVLGSPVGRVGLVGALLALTLSPLWRRGRDDAD
jgi:hypothetical protein